MMWKDKYKVGVELIDEQHKELFKRLSEFIQIVQSKSDWNERLDKVKETMEFMQEYVIFHFDDEEAYQEKINYPDIEIHKEAHRKFKEVINDYVKIFEQGGFTEEKIQEFSAKLMTWLIMHVGKMDQKIGEYANEKGGQAQ
ncbi:MULTISPECIES: bacteriohemerythrin [Tissierella]|jgi:hemerythrin|uniref:Hemerythrin family protein n=1 Tax=Tissierella carlieri TaxID=689904 RepID=A0ABT1SF79_9FIRM|nr:MULTISPECIES: hemerythrin family protein [Tissierella]MCQ4925148.1 hemerythrin family protein [Tissierella carlieri]MDU5080068.1 hemerythrin family protein [Bacillota bacterium]OZV13291.1 hemerythrin [Tissierella sp. P1]